MSQDSPQYKLIAIDLDDTLLTDELTITEGTKKSIYTAIEKGVTITLATGRMYASAKQIASQLKLNVPLLTYQGSLVKNTIDEEVLYERALPTSITKQVAAYCEQHQLHLQFYIHDQLYVRKENEKVKNYATICLVDYQIEPELEELLQNPCTKLLIIEEADRLNRISQELSDLLGNEVHLTRSKPTYLEILHAEGTKGHALHALAKHFNCDLSEVIAIGDSWNDREMIETAGLGVAMGNAIDELKAIADYVTRTNNQEGVKHVIEKFVLTSTAND